MPKVFPLIYIHLVCKTVVFRFLLSFTLTKCGLISPPLVSRLHCESESFKMDLILDVNIQIYPVDLGRLPLICVHFLSWNVSYVAVNNILYITFNILKFPSWCKNYRDKETLHGLRYLSVFCWLRWQVQTGNCQHIIWRWNTWWWRVQSYRWSTIEVKHLFGKVRLWNDSSK